AILWRGRGQHVNRRTLVRQLTGDTPRLAVSPPIETDRHPSSWCRRLGTNKTMPPAILQVVRIDHVEQLNTPPLRARSSHRRGTMVAEGNTLSSCSLIP